MTPSRRTPPATILVALPFTLALSACAGKPAGDAPAPATAIGSGLTTASAGGAATATTPGPATATATTATAAAGAPATSELDATFLQGGEVKTTAGGIQHVDLVVGTGPELTTGSVGVIDFTGWLGDGTEFDSSAKRSSGDFCFELGAPNSVAFFNEGLAGMKVGGTRRFRVTPEQGFGAEGRPPIVPPNSTLLFEMKLRELRAKTSAPDLAALKLTTTASGMKWADVRPGSGPAVTAGSMATISYSAFLPDGTKFDSTIDRCQTMPVHGIGAAPIMPGWNEGLIGMKAGGRRVLVLPPALAFGAAGRPPVVPPDTTLSFVMDVHEVAPGPEPMVRPDVSKLQLTTTASGLQWADLRVGTGREVTAGGTVDVHYTGWLADGTEFDSSVKKGQPYPVTPVGRAMVVAGWNEGLQGMKEGGRRVLVIPPALAYADRGYPPAIPPGATLTFIVEAAKVR